MQNWTRLNPLERLSHLTELVIEALEGRLDPAWEEWTLAAVDYDAGQLEGALASLESTSWHEAADLAEEAHAGYTLALLACECLGLAVEDNDLDRCGEAFELLEGGAQRLQAVELALGARREACPLVA